VIMGIREGAMMKVAIMPGHGGGNPGVCNGEVKEMTYNWLEAFWLKQRLESSGQSKVKICRGKAENGSIFLTKMQERANEFNADICFCLHHNGNNNKVIRGWEVFYYTEKSEKLAEYCRKSFSDKLPINPRVKQPKRTKKGENVYNCIHHCTMPTVLLESCYISNDQECLWLINLGWFQIVNALYAAAELFSLDKFPLTIPPINTYMPLDALRIAPKRSLDGRKW